MKPFIAIALPLIAMIERAVMLERLPVVREIPPWKTNSYSPSVQATRFFA